MFDSWVESNFTQLSDILSFKRSARMNDTGFASELQEMILRRKGDFFYVNGDSIRCVIRNLKFIYSAVIASENLIACAIERLREMEKSAYRDNLMSYFIDHLEEERGHANWLGSDLGAHGVDVSDYDDDAMAMVGSQYYMIYHRHPYCLLGYMAVIEGTPTPIQEIEKLERAYGVKLFRFARYHSIKDEEHKVELFRHIDSIPPQFVDDVAKSADLTLDFIEKAAKHWA